MKKQKNNLSFEIRRQAAHLIAGTTIALLFYFGIITTREIFLLLVFGIFMSVLCIFFRVPVIYHLLLKFERPECVNSFPGRGAVMLLLGSLLSASLFQRNIATAAMLVLAVGDSFSTMSGLLYGKNKLAYNKNKTIEGSVTGFIFAFITSIFFVNFFIALAGSISGMIFESLNLKSLGIVFDDNLLVPVAAGAVMTFVNILI